MLLAKLEPVICPFCGRTMGFTAEAAGSVELNRALYMMAQVHKKECDGVSKEGTKRAKKAQQAQGQQETPNADVIVAQAIEANAAHAEPTVMEQVAQGVAQGEQAKRRGVLQKGEVPAGLAAFNARRAAAIAERVALKAIEKQAKLQEKEAAKAAAKAEKDAARAVQAVQQVEKATA